jgi:hypothetical protein
MISASIYQIVDGTSLVWSSPWFTGWETIYDHLTIQQQPFTYPSQVKDLWIQGQNRWNANLIASLFSPETANAILQTPIVDVDG